MPRTIDPLSTIVLLGTPLLAVVGSIHYFLNGSLSWAIAVFSVLLYFVSTTSITAGYHRCLSHRAYHAHPLLKFFYIFIGGPLAMQGSVLEWCTDHRRHHVYVDTDRDPYNIKRGFLFAHIGWMLEKDRVDRFELFCDDLKRDRWIMFQHRHYYLMATFWCFVFPTMVGALMGDAWGGFLFAGVVRLVLAHHATFFINSLCHFWGTTPYNKNNSAKDNWLMSFLTQGEGYHNFHHKFAADYRNGIRWYDWDPTKWFIRVLSYLGLASKLKTTSSDLILKAKIKCDVERLLSRRREISLDVIQPFQDKIFQAHENFLQLQKEYQQRKSEWKKSQRAKLDKLKIDVQLARLEFEKALIDWQVLSL